METFWIKCAITLIGLIIGLLFTYRMWPFKDRRSLLQVQECNFLRLFILVMNIGTNAVRTFFNKQIPEASLPGHLAKYRNTLKLTSEQRNLIQAAHVQSEDFDITLLYILIRNTMPKTPIPSLGWGKRPLLGHKRATDDVERIRHYRNDIAHNKTFQITSQEFEKIWVDVSQAIDRLSGGCLNKEVVRLRQKIFKQSEKSFFEEEIKCIKDRVIELKQEIANCQDHLDVTDTRHIPLNVRELHQAMIEKWREDDTLFYTTRGCTRVINTLNEKSVVVITGNAGCGKTAIAHHIALTLESQGYEVIPIGSIDEIGFYGKLGRDQIFVIDNIIGTFAVDMSKINNLEDQKEKILTLLSKRSKLLITCRQTVFNEASHLNSFAFRNSIDLHEKTIDLDDVEKLNLLTKHCENESVPKNLYETILFPTENIMFPLLCKLYSQNDRYQLLGKHFFEKPKESMMEEMKHIQDKNTIQYAALVLCVLNNNIISPQCFIPNEIKNEVYENCRLDEGTAKTKIIDALHQMRGSLVKQADDGISFTFIHDFIFEIVAYHYGRQFPNHIINYLPSSFIAQKLFVCGMNSNSRTVVDSDTCIELQEEYFPALAKRLLKDLRSLEIFNVFANEILLNPTFRKEFEKQVLVLPYTEFKSLFFHEQNFAECRRKILRHIDTCMKVENLTTLGGVDRKQKTGTPNYELKCMYPNRYLNTAYIDRFLIKAFDVRDENVENSSKIDPFKKAHRILLKENTYDLLVDVRTDQEGTSCHCRMVSWIVFYGHTDLLQCIISSVLENGDSLGIIFGTCEEENVRLLVLACIHGNTDMVDLLMNYINPGCVNSSPTYDNKCLYNGVYTASNDHRTSTPLTASCRADQFDTVKLLIEKWKADINCWDGDYNTPLSVATELENEKFIEYLLQNGAKPDLMKSFKPPPIVTSAWFGLIGATNLLLKYGSDVNLKFGDLNWTPIFFAAIDGNIDVVKLLLNHNANVNHYDIFDQTPLHIACTQGNVDMVKCILDAGANINKRANTIRTESMYTSLVGKIDPYNGICFRLSNKVYSLPLFDASSCGHSQVVSLLLEKGADVNGYGPDNNTPLYVASGKGHADIVSTLLRYGAKQHIKNKFGSSPLQIALLNNREEIVRKLVKADNEIVNPLGSRHFFELLKQIFQTEKYEEYRCSDSTVPDSVYSLIRLESCENFSNLLKIGFDIFRIDQTNRTIIDKIIFDENVNDRLEKIQLITRRNVSFNNKRNENNISLLEKTRREVTELQRRHALMEMCNIFYKDFFNVRISRIILSNILTELKTVIRRYSI